MEEQVSINIVIVSADLGLGDIIHGFFLQVDIDFSLSFLKLKQNYDIC